MPLPTRPTPATAAGVAALDGEMVDEAHVTVAPSLLDRLGESA
jgi:hypothetical protein